MYQLGCMAMILLEAKFRLRIQSMCDLRGLYTLILEYVILTPGL